MIVLALSECSDTTVPVLIRGERHRFGSGLLTLTWQTPLICACLSLWNSKTTVPVSSQTSKKKSKYFLITKYHKLTSQNYSVSDGPL